MGVLTCFDSIYLFRAQDVYSVEAYTTDAEYWSLLQDCTYEA